jgi:hypothetical protein
LATATAAEDAVAATGAVMKQRRPQVVQMHWRQHQALADAGAKVQALEHATAATITTQQEMTRLAPEDKAAEEAVANAQGAVADAQTAVAGAQTSGGAADSMLTAKRQARGFAAGAQAADDAQAAARASGDADEWAATQQAFADSGATPSLPHMQWQQQ